MLSTREPISRLIFLAHNNKKVLNKSSIEHQIEDLIDIVSYRLNSKPIEVVAESVLDKIFELRFEFIDWFFTNHQDKNIFTELQEKINEEIAAKIQLSQYSSLAKTIAITLDTYGQIFTPIYEKLDTGVLEQVLHNTEDSKPTYETFKLLSYHPAPQMQYLKKWMDASLKLEFGLLVADLAITEQISLPPTVIKKLTEFLNTTLIHFGAYSIFTEFWQPNENEPSHLINKMEILAATIELDNNIYHKSTKENLYHLIHN
jgi:hypothetical protein